MAQLQPDMDTVAIYGFYMALTEGASKAFVVDMVPPEKTGNGNRPVLYGNWTSPGLING